MTGKWDGADNYSQFALIKPKYHVVRNAKGRLCLIQVFELN